MTTQTASTAKFSTPQRRWRCPKCGAEGWNIDGALRPHQHFSRFGFECNGRSIRKYAENE